MDCIMVTLEVFQSLMLSLPPLLKAVADKNMLAMFVTLLTFQVPMGWLKAFANANTLLIFVTELVFQAPMSWLKVAAARNMNDMLVTLGGK
jgi:hypothetical protein